ncbi:hypothetical protein [Deinococcus sp. YIM 77859]|uniref:hypothetical protein n=1 Tax=Deinococcus sp. YIM 77859 TaxID=1540221 RepID=UPI00055282E7|nr:hypothetical protein [Deinococcus sp. YIM 77859]
MLKNKMLLTSAVLMLTATALAGGAGPRATLPGPTGVTPIRTANNATTERALTLEDLRRTSSTAALVSERGVMLATLSGPSVTLPVGSPAGTHVVVKRGDQSIRYALSQPVTPGTSVLLRQITVRGGAAGVAAGTASESAAEVLRGAQAGAVVLLVDEQLRPVATYSAGAFTPVSGTTNAAVYLIRTENGRTTRLPLVRPLRPTGRLQAGDVRVNTVASPVHTRTNATSKVNGNDKVSLCHRTGSETNPYVSIMVSRNALNAHGEHGDVSASADGSCPTGPATSAGGGNTNGGGVNAPQPATGNMNGAAKAGGQAAVNGNDKVSLCHRTGSETNSYVSITVSRNALNAHGEHGDVNASADGNCPTGEGSVPGNAAPVTPALPAGDGNGKGNGATPALPATPAQPGSGQGKGKNGNGALPATPAVPTPKTR